MFHFYLWTHGENSEEIASFLDSLKICSKALSGPYLNINSPV